MKTLNTINNSDIKGENNNILVLLFRSYKLLKGAIKYKNKRTHLIDNPWYGVNDIDIDSYSQSISNLFISEVLKPKKDSKVIGFKEIRYFKMSNKEREAFIEFIRQVFPNAYIIFNRRNLDDVSKSGWWKDKEKKDVLSLLEPFDKWMLDYHAKHQDYTYIVEYDAYKNNPMYFKDLFNWLDEEFDEDKVRKVLETQLTH
jgi:hypothetical protein